MIRLLFVALAVALLALALACKAREEAPASPTPEPATATATPTAAATGTALAGLDQPKLIFLRPSESLFPVTGVLWMSNLDGSDQVQLTPGDVQATFAGLVLEAHSAEPLVYYVTPDGETARSAWRANLATSQRSKLFSFESWHPEVADASVTPDGRYLAYSDIEGLKLGDLTSGEQPRLLVSNSRECTGGIGNCFRYGRPIWSPDGRLLSVRKSLWEGADTVVVDPFQEPPKAFEAPVERAFPSAAEWSLASDALCGYGRYAETSGLYLAEPPDWQFINVLPEYEKYPPDLPLVERRVSSCAWLDSERIALAVDVSRYDSDPDPGPPPENSVELVVFDRRTGLPALISEFTGGLQIWSGGIFPLPGTQLVLTQQLVDEAGTGRGSPSQPELIDVTTGDRKAVLEEGDWIVALVQPPPTR